ncbi:MAG: DUF6268 family outer membrane beta-barrel protein [Verrucomicrobiota bacterium JB025]|nr:DUF6268 family outer membrane beta-barrel protein [Verrucomicrobiota bacterium JB025]
MKTLIAPSLISTIVLTQSFAGEPVTPLPATEADALTGSAAIGTSPLRFGRRNSDSELPGYSFAGIKYNHTFAADFDSLPGDVSSDEFSATFPILPLDFDQFRLFALGRYSATRYNTSDSNLLTLDTLHRFRLPVIFLHDISDKWIWGAMLMPGFSGNQSSSDDLTIAAALGFGYAFSDEFLLFAGGYYSYGFHDHFAVPGIGFIWRPDPLWEVSVLGPMGAVNYRIHENWTLSLFGEYKSPTWHVGADSLGPDRDIEMSALQLGLKAEYHLGGIFWASLAGGYSVFRNMEIEDNDNHTLLDEDLDPAPFVEAGLKLRF